jgi:hypothetical protein
MTSGKATQGYRPDRRRKGAPEEYRPDYRRLADQCRQAARTASTETERADLLARAKIWDFLADHSQAASSEYMNRLAHWR